MLHTWGSALTHYPHVHMIVPGGGIARDGTRWISSHPAFLLPVKVLGKLFRRLSLIRLMALHAAGRLAFFGALAHMAERRAFLRPVAVPQKDRVKTRYGSASSRAESLPLPATMPLALPTRPIAPATISNPDPGQHLRVDGTSVSSTGPVP